MTKTLPAGIKEDRKSGTNKGTLLDFRDSNRWDNRTIHLWTSVLQRKGRMIKEGNSETIRNLTPTTAPGGQTLSIVISEGEWLSVCGSGCCFLMPRGKITPLELQRWDCHLGNVEWLLRVQTQSPEPSSLKEALQPDGILLDWSLSSIFISNSSFWNGTICPVPVPPCLYFGSI